MLVLSASISPVAQSRTRPTIGVIDRDPIQFYHTNRSVILVSSTINNGTGGLDKLVAIVIAFSRLSLRDNGILRNPTRMNCLRRTGTCTFTTSTPKLCAFRKEGSWNLEEMERPGRPLSRLASHRWLGRLQFVVNVFWPKTGGGLEREFLQKAIREAERSTSKWSLKHLPGLLLAQDVVFAVR